MNNNEKLYIILKNQNTIFALIKDNIKEMNQKLDNLDKSFKEFIEILKEKK